MIDRITELREAAEAEIASAASSQELEELRVRHLGRRAPLPQLLRGVADLAPDERAAVGAAANEARRALQAQIDAREAQLHAQQLGSLLETDSVDVTLPGAPPQPVGRLHL